MADARELVTIHCFGDSTTRGADPRRLRFSVAPAPPLALAQALAGLGARGLEVKGEGRDGATAASWLGRGHDNWQRRVRRIAPALVVINLGLNDACHGQGVHPRRFIRSLARLTSQASAAGHTVVLATPNPVSLRPPFGGVVHAWRMGRLVRAMQGLARGQGLAICDQYAAIRALPCWAARVPDGVHPSAWLYGWKANHLARWVIDAGLVGAGFPPRR